jgi:hypothetical protein
LRVTGAPKARPEIGGTPLLGARRLLQRVIEMQFFHMSPIVVRLILLKDARD